MISVMLKISRFDFLASNNPNTFIELKNIDKFEITEYLEPLYHILILMCKFLEKGCLRGFFG